MPSLFQVRRTPSRSFLPLKACPGLKKRKPKVKELAPYFPKTVALVFSCKEAQAYVKIIKTARMEAVIKI